MSRSEPRTPAARSESVRQRRATRSQTRVEHAARNIVTTPVTVRGSGMGNPLLRRTASKPRRVYTVAMQNTGRAYSIPAPTFHFSWRMLSMVVVAALAALIYVCLNNEVFKVDKPAIIGATRVSANDIEAVLKLNGRSVFTVDPEQTARDLEKAFPELQGIQVMVGLPNSVKVQFNERQPVLAWKQKDQVQWVDSKGAVFASRGKAPDKLLTVSSNDPLPRYEVVPTPGPAPTAAPTPVPGATPAQPAADLEPLRMDLKILSSALLLSSQLPKDATLVYSAKEGLGWHDPRGWDVYFGDTLDDLQQKIAMYQAIIAQLDQKKVKPSVINLELLDAPYYRVER